jgi:hypothetical protein
MIALFGFVVGLLALPGRTFRAFVRGRRSHNLYRHRRPASLLGEPATAIRRAMVDRPTARAKWRNVAAFAGLASLALPVGLLLLAATPALVLLAVARFECPLCRLASTSSPS